MERKVFNEQWLALANAFLYAEKKVSLETQDVYWEMLKGIPEDKFKVGVRHCLATCKFFPTIAELGEGSMPTISREVRPRLRESATVWGRRHEDEVAELRRKPEFKKIDWQQQLIECEQIPETSRLPENIKQLTEGIGKITKVKPKRKETDDQWKS